MTERNCESCIFIKGKSELREGIETVFNKGITSETISRLLNPSGTKTVDCWVGHTITPEVHKGEDECRDYFQNFSTRLNDMLDKILERR